MKKTYYVGECVCDWFLSITPKKIETITTDNITEELKKIPFTITAVAIDTQTNQIIDPFNNIKSIKNYIIKANNSNKLDDPDDILKMATFAAKYNFKIESQLLDRAAKYSYRIKYVPPKYIKKYMNIAIMGKRPAKFFSVLYEINALQWVMEPLRIAHDVPQKNHPVNVMYHLLASVNKAAELNLPKEFRYAALLHDIGKVDTPKELLPNHYRHEFNTKSLHKIFSSLPFSYKERQIIKTWHKIHMKAHKIPEMRPGTLLKTWKMFRKTFTPDDIALLVQTDGATPQTALKIKNILETTEKVLNNISMHHVKQKYHKTSVRILNSIRANKLTTALKEL